MHLAATDVHFPDRLIRVDFKETKNLFPQETEVKWIDSLFNSISEKGMKHPILVCSEKNLKDDLHVIIRVPIEYGGYRWRVLVGNNRYAYALANGYTSIDAYEVTSRNDYTRFQNATVLEAHQF
jgi:hypothetical protein